MKLKRRNIHASDPRTERALMELWQIIRNTVDETNIEITGGTIEGLGNLDGLIFVPLRMDMNIPMDIGFRMDSGRLIGRNL